MPDAGRDYPVLAIAGPTASGKSDLALALAANFDGEIVNYDSVQIYRGLDIGSAKPRRSELARIPHHLIDIRDPDEAFSAGDYQRLARAAFEEIRSRNRLPVLVGGTGLYLRAVSDGLFAGPRRSEYWRNRLADLAASRGREHLHRLLERLDREAAGRITPRDTSKIVRALEVRLQTGRPLSDHLREAPRTPIRGFEVHLVGLDPPREALYERIADRVEQMFAAGLVGEVQALLDGGVPADAHAFRAIGYRHVVEYLHGAKGLDEVIIETVRDTRRYAKRQMTWFRRQHTIQWFDGFGSDKETRERIHQFVHDRLRRDSGTDPC